MRYLLTMFLVATLLVGCSTTPNKKNAAQKALPGENRSIVKIDAKNPAVKATMESTSVSKPAVIKVRPPMIPIAPIKETPLLPVTTPLPGWQTFTSTSLEVVMDYPMDWSVTENDKGAMFTSPECITILLQMDKSDNASFTTGQDCTTLINSYGQSGDICFDAATFRYSAIFRKPAVSAILWVKLSMISREKPTVFEQMFDSLRFLP